MTVALGYLLFLIGLHLCWAKLTGRRLPRALAVSALLLIAGGIVLTYGPLLVVGYLGMPRRYHAYPGEWHTLDVMNFTGPIFMAAGSLLVFCYLAWSLRKGAIADSER